MKTPSQQYKELSANNYTVQRFVDGRGRKEEIEKTLAVMLMNNLYPSSLRQSGIPYIGVTGPALIPHIETFKSVFKNKNFYAVEHNINIFSDWQKIALPASPQKIFIRYGDLFDCTTELLLKTKSFNVLCDADLCSPLQEIMSDNWLGFKKIALGLQYSHHVKTLWLIITCTLRTGNKSVKIYSKKNPRDEINDEILKFLKGIFINCEIFSLAMQTYKVGAPMATGLFCIKK